MLKNTVVRLAGALALGALFLGVGSTAAYAQYNTAGSEKAASPAVIAAVSSATASITAGGISSAIGGAGGFGGFVSAGAQTANVRRYGSGASGLGAAAADKPFGVWINGGWTHMKNDFVNTKFDGDAYIGVIGGDYRLTDDLVVGVAAGFEHTDISTKFNSGSTKSDGLGVSPYFAYIVNETFYIDGLVGYTRLNTDVTRTSGAIKGDYNSNRYTGVLNANARFPFDEITVYPQVGVLYVHQRDGSYTETGTGGSFVGNNHVSLGQGRAGAKVGYTLDGFEPYVGARYQYNFVNPDVNLGTVASPGRDRDSVNFQLGLNFNLSNSISGGVEGNSTQFQKDTEQYGVLGSLKFAF
jgi:outer membrane autotransporter protein